MGLTRAKCRANRHLIGFVAFYSVLFSFLFPSFKHFISVIYYLRDLFSLNAILLTYKWDAFGRIWLRLFLSRKFHVFQDLFPDNFRFWRISSITVLLYNICFERFPSIVLQIRDLQEKIILLCPRTDTITFQFFFLLLIAKNSLTLLG